MAKTTEILKANFANQFKPTFVTNPNIAQCQTCHGATVFNNVNTQMDCLQCHGFPHSSTTNMVAGNTSVPVDISLSQNYPNPFNPTTNIKYSIPKSCIVKINVYDALGKLVTTLINDNKSARTYEVEFNGGNLTTGIYFYQLSTPEFIATK